MSSGKRISMDRAQVLIISFFLSFRAMQHSNARIVINQGTILMQNPNVIRVIRPITIIQLTLIIRHRVSLLPAINVILLPRAGNQLPILSMMFSFFQFIREVIKENGLFAQSVIPIRLIIRYLIARDVMPTSIRVKTILMNNACYACHPRGRGD